MRAVDKIIDKFGGVTRMSEILGKRTITTVASWKQRGRIPSSWNSKILLIAREQNISVSHEDFFDEQP
jgi:hypothetical protein